MCRRLILSACLILLVIVAGRGWAAAPEVQTPSSYMPLIRNGPTLTPSAYPTDTNTPIATPTRTATATATVTPSLSPTVGTPTLPPPSYNNCQSEPNPFAAPNYPVDIAYINKVGESVDLKNLSPVDVDITGWHLCSLNGGEQYPIGGGILPAGQTVVIINPGSPVWDDTSPDPGALYNAAGQLVSYYNS